MNNQANETHFTINKYILITENMSDADRMFVNSQIPSENSYLYYLLKLNTCPL